MKLYPNDFVIESYVCFEGASNPDDSAIFYAISSTNGFEGTLLDVDGVYADSLTNEVVEKLKINR